MLHAMDYHFNIFIDVSRLIQKRNRSLLQLLRTEKTFEITYVSLLISIDQSNAHTEIYELDKNKVSWIN